MVETQNDIKLEPAQDYPYNERWTYMNRKRAFSDVAEHMLEPEEDDNENNTNV